MKTKIPNPTKERRNENKINYPKEKKDCELDYKKITKNKIIKKSGDKIAEKKEYKKRNLDEYIKELLNIKIEHLNKYKKE